MSQSPFGYEHITYQDVQAVTGFYGSLDVSNGSCPFLSAHD